jgi:hypothetical protein
MFGGRCFALPDKIYTRLNSSPYIKEIRAKIVELMSVFFLYKKKKLGHFRAGLSS